MLRLTKKADYGLMALKYLAEHSDGPSVGGPSMAAKAMDANLTGTSMSAKDIAEAYGIPAQLLAKILQTLTRAGLLRSHAGMNGGYSLARSARLISAFEVIRAIDGPLFITSCTKGTVSCDLHDSCTIKEPLSRVNDSIADLLKNIRISDLVDQGHAAQVQRQRPEQRLVTIGIQ